MTLATEKLIITIRILPNLSKGKGNLTLKLGQFIECKMTNYFPESRFTKYVMKLVPDPSMKTEMEQIS